MLVFIVKISFSLAVLQTTVMVLVVGPFFPAELKVTFIFPDFPGFTASSVKQALIDKINELDLISLKASLLMSQLDILEIRIQLLLQSFEAKQQKK